MAQTKIPNSRKPKISGCAAFGLGIAFLGFAGVVMVGMFLAGVGIRQILTEGANLSQEPDTTIPFAPPDFEEAEEVEEQTVPEAGETLTPEQCSQKTNIQVWTEQLPASGPCNCNYAVHISAQDESVVYLRTQTYNDPAKATQRWKVERILSGQTFTWTSENVVEEACVPTYLDQVSPFLGIEGCDNMYKRDSYAIENLAQNVPLLCTELR